MGEGGGGGGGGRERYILVRKFGRICGQESGQRDTLLSS